MLARLESPLPSCPSTDRLQLQNVGVTFVYVPFSRSPGEKRADGANLNAFCGAPGDVKKDIDDYYLITLITCEMSSPDW